MLTAIMEDAPARQRSGLDPVSEPDSGAATLPNAFLGHKRPSLDMLAPKQEQAAREMRVISLFTCGMGMDIGFGKAGFNTVYSNDIAKFACDTIRQNRPGLHCDEGDITEIRSEQILESAGARRGEVDVVIGGPPCQSFSTAGMRRGLEDKRGMALLEFIRVVKDVRPKFFVFENVSGLVSAARKHVPFYDRISAGRKLSEDQKCGSLFADILSEFEKIDGYRFQWKLLNAADYGVPQKRKRLILIGSRIADPELVLKEIEGRAKYADPKQAAKLKKKPWRTLRDALEGLDDADKECTRFPKWGRYLEYVPPGGCWVDLPDSMKNQAMGRAADTDDPKRKGKQGGRRGFYRRLSWDSPAPTLVTSPTQMGTCICHPDETRPLTVREYARIQGFPDDWNLVGSTAQKYRMIGEAVPVDLAKIIAKTIAAFVQNK